MWFLIMILIIVIVYLLLNRRVEGFEVDKTKKDKKALICYYGGSFREGNIGSTKADTKYGYESQKNASISHEKLKSVLQEKGYQADILINTRETKYSDKLEKWYEPFNMILNDLSNKVHGRDEMIQSSVKNINKLNKKEYEFILFVRIDLFLKPAFFDVIDTETDKISFLANNYNYKDCHKTFKNDPEVIDLFVLIPKKYFYILDKKFKLNHYSWSEYKKIYRLQNADLTFMTDELFESNTYMEPNPYYVMGSRSESKTILNADKKKKKDVKCVPFNKNKTEFIKNPSEYYIKKYNDFYLST